MRIGEMTSNEVSNGRRIPKFANFGVKLWFSKMKKIPKISEIPQFCKSANLHYRQTHKIIKFLKLFNFEN